MSDDGAVLGAHNPRIQRLRRLLGRRSARRDESAYVIEGSLLVAEALASGVSVEIFVEESSRHLVPPGATPARVTNVRDGVLVRLASTETPQPIVATAPIVGATLADIAARLRLASTRFAIVAAGINDPGNLGTMLRSAEAAGAAGLVVIAGSVDPWNPKCVRASAGAIFHVPVADGVAVTALGQLGVPLVGTVATGGLDYTAPGALDGALALVLGNEAHGLPEGLVLDRSVTIPHAGRAESLNVAMAAAVLSFEWLRRSRAGR